PPSWPGSCGGHCSRSWPSTWPPTPPTWSRTPTTWWRSCSGPGSAADHGPLGPRSGTDERDVALVDAVDAAEDGDLLPHGRAPASTQLVERVDLEDGAPAVRPHPPGRDGPSPDEHEPRASGGAPHGPLRRPVGDERRPVGLLEEGVPRG